MSKAADMVAQAKARTDDVTPDQLEKELAEGALVIDIREGEELAATGKIPGSVHSPRGLLEFRADPDHPMHQDGFDTDRRVILHCASGGRSALAADMLKDLGYTNVAHMDGGINRWLEAGKPVDKD
jgi:rhodanese-related sulfurtransferase